MNSGIEEAIKTCLYMPKIQVKSNKRSYIDSMGKIGPWSKIAIYLFTVAGKKTCPSLSLSLP